MAIKLTWDDLLIEAGDLDPEILAHGWAWLVTGEFRVVAATKFGDWFLERPNGAIQMLDAVKGTLDSVAESHSEFQKLINRPEKQEEWLLSELVLTLHEKGMVPRRGQCYSFKLPLVLGGKAESDNVELCDFRLSVSLCGQIHEQTRDLPEGTPIKGFRVEE